MGHYVIATDEAGYGPKLGPLVVAATTWEMAPGSDPEVELAVVSEGISGPDQQRYPIADSKELFQRGAPAALRQLEVLVAVAMRALSARNAQAFPLDLAELLSRVANSDLAQLELSDWFTTLANHPFPSAIDDWQAFDSPGDALESSVLSPLRFVSARVFSAPHFNRACKASGNKANLLSETSLQLVRTRMAAIAAEAPQDRLDFTVFCDRHGGRQNYAGVLQQSFPEAFPWVRSESHQLSRYHLDTDFGALEIQFRVKGDQFGPVALASIFAKYLRERLMDCWNAFWKRHVGESLRPTAGYGSDAQRFLNDITATANRLGIHSSEYWRDR